MDLGLFGTQPLAAEPPPSREPMWSELCNYMMRLLESSDLQAGEVKFPLRFVVEIAPGRPLYLRGDFYIGTHSA